MSRVKRATQVKIAPSVKAKTQRLPITIEKFYVQQAGRNKGELSWTEGKPKRPMFPYEKGKTVHHTKRITITAPTNLPGLLSAIAATIGQSAADTSYDFHARGQGVCIQAYANERRPGKPAVAIVNDIQSPYEWHRDPDNHWTCLPDSMDSLMRYRGADHIIQALPAGAPMEGWVWEKPRQTVASRVSLIAMKTTLKIMAASRRLSLADAREIDRLVTALIRKRAA